MFQVLKCSSQSKPKHKSELKLASERHSFAHAKIRRWRRCIKAIVANQTFIVSIMHLQQVAASEPLVNCKLSEGGVLQQLAPAVGAKHEFAESNTVTCPHT